MIHLVQPRHVVPIQYNDYTVFKSPIEDFLKAVEAAGLSAKLHFLRHGDSLSLDQIIGDTGGSSI